MARSVAMIHTVASLVGSFHDLSRELLPDTVVYHFVDESLLTITREAGKITPQTRRRLLGHAASAQEIGVVAALVTCSSVGPAVEAARQFVDIPLIRVDEAMAEAAVQTGRRVGVIATLRSTLEPTQQLIERTAAAAGKSTEVVARLCDGAFEAASRGDTSRHDALVAEGILDLSREVDVIVLAQASMARALSRLADQSLATPVLSSPRSAVERLRDVAMAQ
jgi:Asp/Glu/hydantoin racemase